MKGSEQPACRWGLGHLRLACDPAGKQDRARGRLTRASGVVFTCLLVSARPPSCPLSTLLGTLPISSRHVAFPTSKCGGRNVGPAHHLVAAQKVRADILGNFEACQDGLGGAANVSQLEWCACVTLLDHVVRDFFDQPAQSVSPHRCRVVGGEHGYLSAVADR